ncbi:MAG: hypothetical protein U9P44_04085, partial [archaeon]|nr:hypothetical protein [archaeon]
MNKIGKSVSILIMLVLAAGLLPAAYASDEGTCTVYFTGIGCSHCAHTDPVVLDDLPKTTDIVVIEYEIFRASANSHVMNKYNDNYNMGFGVPQIIFSKETYLRGDTPILQKTAALIDELSGNKCPLYDGASASFDEIDITSLPGEPNIWKGERILMHSGGGGDAGLLKNLLVSESISSVVE